MSTALTPELLAELRRGYNHQTPGHLSYDADNRLVIGDMWVFGTMRSLDLAVYFAALHNALPALLDAAEELATLKEKQIAAALALVMCTDIGGE